MKNILLITIVVFMTILDSAFAENKEIPKLVRENNSDTDNRASQKQTKSFGIAAQGTQWLFLSGGAGI